MDGGLSRHPGTERRRYVPKQQSRPNNTSPCRLPARPISKIPGNLRAHGEQGVVAWTILTASFVTGCLASRNQSGHAGNRARLSRRRCFRHTLTKDCPSCPKRRSLPCGWRPSSENSRNWPRAIASRRYANWPRMSSKTFPSAFPASTALENLIHGGGQKSN